MSFPFAPLVPGAYDFVMLDPPWHFDVRSKKGDAKSPQAQYPTMTLDEIAALPVADLLAPGGVVWLWGTWPLFGQQHLLCERAFGLKVRTGGAWAKRTRSGKLRHGTGFVLSSTCEPFLIAARDGHRFKANGRHGNLIESVENLCLDGLAREHSRKPEEAYRLVEAMTPGWRRADVFAIDVRDNWEQFGNQLGKKRRR